MNTASKLSVQNLAKLYDGVPVLERVNLEVQTGSFCTIVGAFRLRKIDIPADAAFPGTSKPWTDPPGRCSLAT